MANSQTRLIIVLGAVLLAVIAVSSVVLLLLPSEDTADITEPFAVPEDALTTTSQEETITSDTTPSTLSTEGFDLRVLQSAGYLSLDKLPIQEGALPVPPPGGVGKANPFL